MSAIRKRAYNSRKYNRLIQWIADNDALGDADSIEVLKTYLTVVLVADCYDLKDERVATDVFNLRKGA